MRGSFKAAGLAAALALVVAAPAVTATMPGRNGRITYAVQDDTGQQQIWIAGADEAHPVQLTFAANTSLATDWSPDASRIAFDSDRTGDVEVYTMKPDGSDVVRLTFDPGFDAAPAYSADGSTLVWDHEAADASENGLYLMRASDGGAVRRLTVAPQDAARFVIDIDPQFSPDGRRVAFSRFRLADHGTVSAIHIVDVDGIPPAPGHAVGLGQLDPRLVAGRATARLRDRDLAFPRQEGHPGHHGRESRWIRTPEPDPESDLIGRRFVPARG